MTFFGFVVGTHLKSFYERLKWALESVNMEHQTVRYF